MSVYGRPTAGAYFNLAPQQTYALPGQQPPPSDVRAPPNGQSQHFTLPPGVPLHANPRDLIVELCKIIERQSQEITAMRQERFQERGAPTVADVLKKRAPVVGLAVALGQASAIACADVTAPAEQPRVHERLRRALHLP